MAMYTTTSALLNSSSSSSSSSSSYYYYYYYYYYSVQDYKDRQPTRATASHNERRSETSIQLISAVAVSYAPRSYMDRIAAARGAIVCFRFDLVELRRCCTLRRRRLARHYY